MIISLTLKLPGEGQMALPLNLNDKNILNADFSWYFRFIHFSLIKCEWIATENICKKFYSFERKIKLNLVLNFDLTLGSFRVK